MTAARARCVYAERSQEAYQVDPTYGGDWGGQTPIELWLCCWSLYAPESVEAMAVMPGWLVKWAMAGQPLTGNVCDSCTRWKGP